MPTSSRTLFIFSSLFIGMLSTVIVPPVGSSKKFIQRKSVDLPEPLGPIITTTSRSSICKSIPFKTSSSPKDFFKFFISIIAKLLIKIFFEFYHRKNFFDKIFSLNRTQKRSRRKTAQKFIRGLHAQFIFKRKHYYAVPLVAYIKFLQARII